jgi:hypothetical protein
MPLKPRPFMKKIDLIHATILIIALLAGYSAINTFIALLSFSGYISDIFMSESRMGAPLVSTLVTVILLSGTCILLIKNGRKLAERILKNDPETASDQTSDIPLDRHSLIFVLLIGMGIYIMIQAIPATLSDLFDLFQNKIATDLFKHTTPDKEKVIVELLRITVGAFLVFAAPTLTNWIDRQSARRSGGESQP